MSLLEWMGEAYSPGPIGGFAKGPRGTKQPSRVVVIICAVISLALLGLEVFLVHSIAPELEIDGWLVVAGITLVYLIAGYFIHPKPDTSNLGWAGGLIDNPFRISDDLNRTLLFLKILLFPGRFVSESIARMVRLVRNA